MNLHVLLFLNVCSKKKTQGIYYLLRPPILCMDNYLSVRSFTHEAKLFHSITFPTNAIFALQSHIGAHSPPDIRS